MAIEIDTVERWLGERQDQGLVKICGLREPAHTVAAVEVGADLIGFIFAPTRRQVSAAAARSCIDAARQAAEQPIMAVGVFVNTSAEVINQTADEAGLDLIQLSGDEPPDFAGELNLPVISGLRPRPGARHEDVAVMIQDRLRSAVAPAFFLVDGHDPYAWGGTGRRADWELAAAVAPGYRLLLAGGLDPANVAAAIAQVRPLGVDVSSGVETGGVKDPVKIAAFVSAARAGFSAVQPAH